LNFFFGANPKAATPLRHHCPVHSEISILAHAGTANIDAFGMPRNAVQMGL
jgi:hypothetical protein